MSNDSKGDYYEDDFMESDMEPAEEAKQGAMDALAKGEEMDELKPCPFCGSKNTTLDYFEISCSQELGTLVFCGDCGSYSTSIDRWNTRPIEDKLLARLAERDALIERLVEAGEVLDVMHDDSQFVDDVAKSRELWRALVAEYRAMKGGEG